MSSSDSDDYLAIEQDELLFARDLWKKFNILDEKLVNKDLIIKKLSLWVSRMNQNTNLWYYHCTTLDDFIVSENLFQIVQKMYQIVMLSKDKTDSLPNEFSQYVLEYINKIAVAIPSKNVVPGWGYEKDPQGRSFKKAIHGTLNKTHIGNLVFYPDNKYLKYRVIYVERDDGSHRDLNDNDKILIDRMDGFVYQ